MVYELPKTDQLCGVSYARDATAGEIPEVPKVVCPTVKCAPKLVSVQKIAGESDAFLAFYSNGNITTIKQGKEEV